MRPGALATTYSTILALPFFVDATALDCKDIRTDGVSFNLDALAGQHSVFEIYKTPVATRNTTFTLSICGALGRNSDKDKADECPNDTWICALDRYYHNGTEGEPKPDDLWPIAGDFIHESRDLDATPTRLKGSASHADTDKEGFRLELNGGLRENVKQKAIIEFLCDPDKTGLEGEKEPAKDKDGKETRADADEGKDPSPEDPNKGKSLQFVSYKQGSTGKADDEVGVLRLQWTTKYACENRKDVDDGDKKSSTKGWGFFTWFIIILFLVVSAYLIFGSWLNYSRHGARGWDLLPHGDSLRDLPYLLRDWGRRAFSTVQGSNGGGGRGYSAI